jgi:hypothetical protein
MGRGSVSRRRGESGRPDGSGLRDRSIRWAGMTFTTAEILVALGVGLVLAAAIGAYMVISRRKGWM